MNQRTMFVYPLQARWDYDECLLMLESSSCVLLSWAKEEDGRGLLVVGSGKGSVEVGEE
jgi:hypothetical protein